MSLWNAFKKVIGSFSDFISVPYNPSVLNTLMAYTRTGLTADTGEISGQALSEAIPTSPFATDKHFCEIGHVLETRTGAGLAKVVLHFN